MTIGTSLNHLARATPGVAAPTVIANLEIGTREYGRIAGAFQPGIMTRSGVSPINARRGAFPLGAVLMTPTMFVGPIESPALAMALFCLGGGRRGDRSAATAGRSTRGGRRRPRRG